jgi:hypothetical protein
MSVSSVRPEASLTKLKENLAESGLADPAISINFPRVAVHAVLRPAAVVVVVVVVV